MKKKKYFLCLLCLLLTACGGEKQIKKEDTLTVLTSFYPIYLLAEEVTQGAAGIRLENMAQPQTGCLHDYELTIQDMKRLEQADIFIVNGGGMEGFLEQALERYPDLEIIDTSQGIDLLAEEGHHHEGETEQEHEAHEGNPHIWLSPRRAAHQAETIAEALSLLDEQDAALFAENAAAFCGETERLTAEAEALSLGGEEEAALFHEGFLYLAELFGMEAEIGIFADEYEEPSAKELTAAVEEAKEDGIRFYLTAADNGEKYARTLAAETKGRVILLDPVTTGTGEPGAYVRAMEQNIQAMKQALREGETEK